MKRINVKILLGCFLLVFCIMAAFFTRPSFAGLCFQDSNCPYYQQCGGLFTCGACNITLSPYCATSGSVTSGAAQNYQQQCTQHFVDSGSHCDVNESCACVANRCGAQCGSSSDCGSNQYCSWSDCKCHTNPTTCGGAGGVCNRPGHACPAGYVASNNTYECSDICCIPAGSNQNPPPPPTCTVTQDQYVCTTSTSQACGYLVSNHGGPVWHRQVYNTCTGYSCYDSSATICQGTISGHTFFDYNGNGKQDSGEPNTNTYNESTIQIHAQSTNQTWNLTVSSSGLYSLNPTGNDLYGTTYTAKVTTAPANYTVTNGQYTFVLGFTNRNPNNINFGIRPNLQITGTVKSSTGTALANVAVVVTDTTLNQSHTYNTDAAGNFTSANFLHYGDAYTVTANTNATVYPCNSGYICGNTWTPNSPNPYKVTGTVTITDPNGDACNGNCNFVYTPGQIGGHVYLDYNHDGQINGSDTGYAGITVSTPGETNVTTDSSGSYTFNTVSQGTHTITITVPTNYAGVGATSKTITIGPNSNTVNFYLTPLYEISGVVFKDTYKDFSNGNACYEQGSDQLYTDSTSTISVVGQGNLGTKKITTSTGSFNTNDAAGHKTLLSGTYSVSFATTLPAGYEIKTPSSYTVTVGQSPACNAGNAMAYCNSITSPPAPSVPLQPSCTAAKDVQNISFGLNNENPFFQVFCQDYSSNKGVYDPLPPAGTTCGGVQSGYLSYSQASCNIPGIVFYDGTYYFGQGAPNPNNVLVNQPYTPLNPTVNQVAYSFIETTLKTRGITPTDLSGVDPTTGSPYCTTSSGTAGLANCQLEANLPSGIYQIGQTDTDAQNEDLTITASPTFNTDVNNPKTYIFLISGNLTITKKIIVPNGASVAFITQAGITVDSSVGEQDATSMNPDLEGIYVAGTDFTIQTIGTTGALCKADGTNLDKRLNIVGYVVTGAEGSGSIINQRDLCSYDLNCPSYSTSTGDTSTGNGQTGIGNTYLLNLSNALKLHTSFQQEAAPGGN